MDKFSPEHTVVFLPCDDAQEAVEFALTKFGDDDTWCEINVMDTYCGVKESKLTYRIKRAWKAFKGEPVYYSGVCVDDLSKVKKFFKDCIKIIDKEG